MSSLNEGNWYHMKWQIWVNIEAGIGILANGTKPQLIQFQIILSKYVGNYFMAFSVHALTIFNKYAFKRYSLNAIYFFWGSMS